MRTRKFVAVAAGLTTAFALAACGGEGAGSGGGDAAEGGAETTTDAGGGDAPDAGDLTIGVAMPTQTSERWIADGNAVQSQLEDRKSTRLNSSHVKISYAVFCLKKKKQTYYSDAQ